MVSITCEVSTTNDDFMKNYLQKISNFPSLSPNDEKHYLLLAQKGDENARKIVIAANLKLVVMIAKKSIHTSKLPICDLIQEGNLGLMASIDKFKCNLGYKFATYASWWIRQAMFKAISEQAYSMKIPVYVQETLSKYRKVKSELERKYNCEVKNSDVAKEMGFDADKIDSFLNAYTKTISLENNMSEDENSMSFSEIVEDEKQNVEVNLELEELKRDIIYALKSLKDKEKDVIYLRFGLSDDGPKTLLEIGNKFGVTKECIRQMERRALEKIYAQDDLKNLLQCYVA